MLLFSIVACEQSLEKEKIELQEYNTLVNWTVNAYIDNNIIFGPFTISTQTASSKEAITIKDNGSFWKFQTKAELIKSTDRFNAKSSINEISSLGAKININGSIFDKDSISFDIQFEDDETPYGFTYIIRGHRN